MRTEEEKKAEEKRVSNAVKGDKRFKLSQARAIYRMVNIVKRGVYQSLFMSSQSPTLSLFIKICPSCSPRMGAIHYLTPFKIDCY